MYDEVHARMYISPTYPERGIAQSRWQAFVRRIHGAWGLMASIATGGVTLPTWALTVMLAAALATTGAGIKMAVGQSETLSATVTATNNNTTAILREDARIDRLEGVFADVASMKSDLASTKATAEKTDDKLDRLIDRQLSRQHP